MVVVGREDAHAGGLLAGHVQRRDRDVGLLLDVEGDQPAVVHLVDVVAREHEHQVRRAALDEREVLRDRVGGALVPVGRRASAEGLVDLDAAGEACGRGPTAGPTRCARSGSAGRYCVRIMTSEIPEFTQLDSVKSMIRYLPAKGTAGLARFSVSTPSREPSPPARMTARALISGGLLSSRVRRHGPLVERGVLRRRPRPGEVPGHPVALELRPFGGLSVHPKGALERVPERPRSGTRRT